MGLTLTCVLAVLLGAVTWAGAPGVRPVADTGRAAAATPAGRHADPELEAMLPRALGGAPLVVESQAGTDLSTRSAAFDGFLTRLGRSRAEFTVASAYSDRGLRAEIGAWRVRGAAPDAMLDGLVAAMQAASSVPLTVVPETLAGQSVTRIGDPGQLARGPLWVIARDGVLLFVQTPDRALAEEAIGKLAG